MITPNLNIKSENGTVRYYIVQHVPDLFRRESRNVGVIVQRAESRRAKFFGERSDGKLDGRSISCFDYPLVYRQWVKYWRRCIERGGDCEKRLMRPNGDHFNVIDAGAIQGAAGDSLDDVCHYAYSMLVSDGGLAEALGSRKGALEATENLRNDVASEFRSREILGGRSLFVPHPVLAQQLVQGETQSHTFSFAQQRDGWTVMETVNFSTTQKQSAKDHAGWAAHAFGDTKRRWKDRVHPIAIIRCTDSDRENELVRYAIDMLKQESHIIQWEDKAARQEFLSERERVAGQR